MLRICEVHGFDQTSVPDEPGLVRMVLRRRDGAAARSAS
jgi:hypothetical protein